MQGSFCEIFSHKTQSELIFSHDYYVEIIINLWLKLREAQRLWHIYRKRILRIRPMPSPTFLRQAKRRADYVGNNIVDRIVFVSESLRHSPFVSRPRVGTERYHFLGNPVIHWFLSVVSNPFIKFCHI